MKRIIFTLSACLLIFSMIQGQQPAPTSSTVTFNFEQYQKKITKSDADIQDPKKSIAPKTWYSRGTLMQSVHELNQLRSNITTMMNSPAILVKSNFGEPKETKSVALANGTQQDTYVYEGFNLIMENNKLTDWDQTRFLVDRPLDKAYEAFMKCQELDKEGKMAKKLVESLKKLVDQYHTDGIFEYLKATKTEDEATGLKYYTGAFQSFKNAVDINHLPAINKQDTAFMYYAGFCANKSKKYPEAIEYLNMARALKLDDPAMYQLLGETYIATGDTAKGIEVVKEGISTVKETSPLVIFLVNFYLKTNNSRLALEYITIAKQQDPTNKTLYFVEGTLYDKLDDFDKAVAAYSKAMEMDPKYFEPAYNYAACHFNKAVKLIDDAVQEKDNKIYEKKIKVAYEALEAVVPLMEKARTLAPDTENMRSVLETLKNIYYRLKLTDKLDEVNEKLKNL